MAAKRTAAAAEAPVSRSVVVQGHSLTSRGGSVVVEQGHAAAADPEDAAPLVGRRFAFGGDTVNAAGDVVVVEATGRGAVRLRDLATGAEFGVLVRAVPALAEAPAS